MIKIQFPVVTSPLDGQEYLVVADAPEYQRQPGFTIEYMRVIGISRSRKYVEFTVPMDVWRGAEQRLLTFHETPVAQRVAAAPQGTILAGSRIKEPWRIALPVIDDFVALLVRSFGSKTHYTVQGMTTDSKPIEKVVEIHAFNQANSNPVWFVEVETDHAPVVQASAARLIGS